jgi:hypothetical protein
MSAFGTKRTSQSAQLMSAFGGKADIALTASVQHGPAAGFYQRALGMSWKSAEKFL